MIRILTVLTGVLFFKNANPIKCSFRMSHHNSRGFLNMKKDGIDVKSLSRFYKPKTENQEQYVKYLEDKSIKILFTVGPAGTGKTMLACNQAIKELKSGAVDKIVLTRPVIPVEEEEIGFLPGNINKKMDPWTRPIFDIFYEFYQKKDIESMLHNNVIEISPLAFMRGRTFKNAFIIADEMQNSSPNQMMMLTTRIGDGSKMVITGDLKQSDRDINSGLSDFIKKYDKYNNYLIKTGNDTQYGIKLVELTSDDIERSKVIKRLLDIYEFNDVIINKMSEVRPSITIDVNSSKNKTLTTVVKDFLEKNENENIYDNDAALIPKNHMSKQYKN
jgi:phosphate starvation-inducible PhoH-like protein